MNNEIWLRMVCNLMKPLPRPVRFSYSRSQDKYHLTAARRLLAKIYQRLGSQKAATAAVKTISTCSEIETSPECPLPKALVGVIVQTVTINVNSPASLFEKKLPEAFHSARIAKAAGQLVAFWLLSQTHVRLVIVGVAVQCFPASVCKHWAEFSRTREEARVPILGGHVGSQNIAIPWTILVNCLGPHSAGADFGIPKLFASWKGSAIPIEAPASI